MGQGVRQADRESVWAAKLRAGRGLSERPVQKGAAANAFPVFVPTRRPAARTLRRCDFLTAEHDPVIEESDELVRIVATVIRKAEGGG